ncbi:LEA type 2 family protein [Polluticaenibacter yanchengensis]|uniref:Late embryogenesis abundant protein LEA-2 subgroup domain-containing protein n=1 Tax=Polluticaenibacter yanchengensis TaxID=3014562 RepID=A0ABT4UN22_9BACT|nr:hypothetical protein [Chitinophagaceae bacterium LY-5]
MNNKRFYFLLLIFSISFFSCTVYKQVKFEGLSNLEVVPYTFAKTKVNADLKVNNPNKYNIVVKELQSELFINNEKITDYNLYDTSIVIPALQDYIHQLKLDVSTLTLLNSALNLNNTDSINYSIRGKIKVSAKFVNKTLPIDYNGKISARDLR